MKVILEVLDEVGYLGLSAIAFATSVFILGAGFLVVGGIWVTWRMWDSIGLPVETVFTTALNIAFWPAKMFLDFKDSKDEIEVAAISFLGWFIFLLTTLFIGRTIRVIQGKADHP